MNNYLQSIVDSIKSLKNEGKFEQALEVLEQELSSNYVTSEYITIFEKMQRELTILNQNKNFEEQFKNKTKSQILNIIFKNNKLNLPAIYFLFDNFEKEINKEDLTKFNTIFLSEINNSEKIYLLSLLKSFNKPLINNHEFLFLNKIYNRYFKITIGNKILFDENEYFIKVNKLIDNQSFKTPSNQQMCHNIAQAIYENLFNDLPECNAETMANYIITYISSLLSNETYENKEFIKFINNILEGNKTTQQS